SPIREQLCDLRARRRELTYPDRAIRSLSEALQELARRFGVREPVERLDKVSSLRASFGDAKARYEELKQRLTSASESTETTQLERKVKQAQNQMNTIASELQRLKQAV